MSSFFPHQYSPVLTFALRLQLTDYLEPPPEAANSAQPSASEEQPKTPLPPYGDPSFYSSKCIRTVLSRLNKFRLTKAELMMILNLRPGDLNLLDAIIEECDDRYSEDQQQEMLQIVRAELGGGEPDDSEAEGFQSQGADVSG